MQDVGRSADKYLGETADKLNALAVSQGRLRLWPENSLLIPKSGASILLNHRRLLAQPSYVVSHLAVVIPGPLVDPEYLYYYSLLIDAADLVPDTSYPSLRLSDLETVRIPLPPLPEQHRIVEILRKADTLRQLRRQANERANDLLPALFQEMFGDIEPNKTYPRNWEVVPLSRLFTDTQYGISDSLTATSGGNVGVLRMNNVTAEGQLDLADMKYIAPQEVDLGLYDLRDGDILFNRTNSPDLVGKIALWESQPDKQFTFASYLIRVRLTDRALPEYVWAALNSAYGKAQMRRLAKQAVSMANINTGELGSIRLVVPPLPIQRQFRTAFLRHRDNLELARESTLQLERLWQSLLAQAFGGQLTAAWREAHTEELAAAAAERDRLLAAAGHRRPAALTVQAAEQVAVTDAATLASVPPDDPRYDLLAALSPHQLRLYCAVRDGGAYVTAESLAEQVRQPAGQVAATLALLDAAGLVQAAAIPTKPGDRIVYVDAYRALRDDIDLPILEPAESAPDTLA
jgi:type I restriction enzyme S subunit